MSEVSREALKKRIEPHFYDALEKDNYAVKCLPASQLLTHDRFDLAFKLLYLELIEYDSIFAKNIYEDHIRAFSLGKFTEPGDAGKSGIESFVEQFKQTYADIETNGFDKDKSLIPLSMNGSIANGAHRLASAIHLKKEVECVKIDCPTYYFDYKYFYRRNVPLSTLDAVASTFIKNALNVYIAIVWPVAEGRDDEVLNSIPNIFYRKEINLNANGAQNFIPLVYAGEAWLGSVENNFKGSKGKTIECFKPSKPMRVVAFQASGLEEVLSIKEKIRAIFNLGKHSIHITDDQQEAIKISQIIFNDNGIHFLNYAKPNRFLSTHKMLQTYKEFMQRNKLDSNGAILDSGMVLSIYGLREANDIDYLSLHEHPAKYADSMIEENDDELIHHQKPKQEMIFNPHYYFYFYGVKIVSFAQLHQMKMRRKKPRDVNDCLMMDALLENNKFKEYSAAFQQKLLYAKLRLKDSIIIALESLHLLNFIKKVLGR